jgi:nucleotidyltransferase/DNA polymerase involved in DNA repair
MGVDHSQAGKCQDLISSEAAIDAYKAISLHIRQIFAEYTPIIESLSLDEAYFGVHRKPKPAKPEPNRLK